MEKDVGITGPVKFDFQTGTIKRTAMAFWCVMISREVINDIGILDEIFSPGTGEDGDFCIRAEQAGYELVQVPNNTSHKFGTGFKSSAFPIFHHGSATFGPMEVSAIIKRNKDILDQRYGVE